MALDLTAAHTSIVPGVATDKGWESGSYTVTNWRARKDSNLICRSLLEREASRDDRFNYSQGATHSSVESPGKVCQAAQSRDRHIGLRNHLNLPSLDAVDLRGHRCSPFAEKYRDGGRILFTAQSSL